MRKIILSAALAALFASPALAGGKVYGLGVVATPEQVKAWDIDIRPDGKGAFVGKGSVKEGEPLYEEKCASCHGLFGDGGDNARFPVLVGGSVEALVNPNPEKTIGSYWPYASTLVDYIYRAMPYGDAQSLTPDETYAIAAWLLNANNVVPDDFVLSNENIGKIKMPNANGFIPDNRPDTPGINLAKGEKPCMKNCVKEVKIIGRAKAIDVTPEDRPPN